jgi:hypothetical protein
MVILNGIHMHLIYKITYTPHIIANTPPYYYIGSKFNYYNNYYGSPASNQKDWYTGNLTIAEWWKAEIKKNVDNFKFEIIREFINVTPQELVEFEKEFHIKLDVRKSEYYFNKSIATTGWVSAPRTEKTKQVISEKTKEYWNSPEGMLKKQRLSERNKKTKSEEMKNRWQSDVSFKEKASLAGKRKRTSEQKEVLSKAKLKNIEYKGQIYIGWKNLLKETGVSEFLYKKYYLNGYDPEVNIGIKHNPQKILLFME